MDFFKRIGRRIRGGARLLLGSSERQLLLEAGVRFLRLAVDEEITEAEVSEADHVARAALTAAASSERKGGAS